MHWTGVETLDTLNKRLLSPRRSDEFALIAPDADALGAVMLAERLRAAAADGVARLCTPVTLSGRAYAT